MKIEVTDEMIDTALKAVSWNMISLDHRLYLQTILEAVFDMVNKEPEKEEPKPEKGKIPTLLDYIEIHPSRYNKNLVMTELELVSEYLHKYMKEKG